MSADYNIASMVIPSDPGRRLATISYHGYFYTYQAGSDTYEVRLTINGTGVKVRRPNPSEAAAGSAMAVEFTHVYEVAANASDTIAAWLHFDQGGGSSTTIQTFGDPSFNLLQVALAGMGV